MVASCDRSVRFWINAKQLKDPDCWEAGWKTLKEIDRSQQLSEKDVNIVEY